MICDEHKATTKLTMLNVHHRLRLPTGTCLFQKCIAYFSSCKPVALGGSLGVSMHTDEKISISHIQKSPLPSALVTIAGISVVMVAAKEDTFRDADTEVQIPPCYHTPVWSDGSTTEFNPHLAQRATFKYVPASHTKACRFLSLL